MIATIYIAKELYSSRACSLNDANSSPKYTSGLFFSKLNAAGLVLCANPWNFQVVHNGGPICFARSVETSASFGVVARQQLLVTTPFFSA